MSEAPYTLHVWPAKWNLQSLDPTCLAAIMYLQLTIPGRFKVAHCTNPDQSPNGQLPFLTHAHTAVTTFPSIVAFVASLAKSSSTSGAIDLDASLTSLQRAKRTALYAHVEGCISDIVMHMFYGINENFWRLTNPALASEMPVLQKYYVPSRIREAYRPRLEAAGLWKLPDAEEEQLGMSEKDKKKKRNYKVTFERAFARELVLDKAKTALGIYSNYLDGKRFFFGDHPTSLDVYFAAHILLFAGPPFPDAVLQIQLLESFPGLVKHAQRIQASVERAPAYELSTPSWSLRSFFIPRSFSSSGANTQVDPEDIQYRRRTLLFVLGVMAMTAGCISTQFLLMTSGTVDDLEADIEDGKSHGGTGDEGEGNRGDEAEERAGGSGAFTDEDED